MDRAGLEDQCFLSRLLCLLALVNHLPLGSQVHRVSREFLELLDHSLSWRMTMSLNTDTRDYIRQNSILYSVWQQQTSKVTEALLLWRTEQSTY